MRRVRRAPLAAGAALTLHERLEPLSFLLGEWRGLGVVGYPSMTESRFEQELSFTTDGRPFLTYSSRTWLLDDDGNRLRPSSAESGFWRPGENERDVEVVLSNPTGIAEVYDGEVVFRKIELRTIGIGRTPTAKEVTGLHRLYGLVDNGDLAYAVDMKAVGHDLQPHFSALLSRVG